MLATATTGLGRLVRGMVTLALMVSLAVMLAACAGANNPFSKSRGSLLSPTGKTPPPVTIGAMNGLPTDKAQILFTSLAASAGKRDIAIVKGQMAGNFTMTGDFQAVPGSAGVVVSYRWVVTDARGQLVHTIQSQETGQPATGNPWAGVDADVLRRIAAFTAENLSSRLSQLGYATQAAGLPPPPNTMVLAGPDAEKQIDLETLYGPDYASIVPVVDAAESSQALAVEAPVAAPQTAPAKKPSGPGIHAVAVTRVSGSPGKGNDDLLIAMRRTLAAAGWDVLARARGDALTIHGEVGLAPPGNKTQRVTLKWVVAMPDGRVLGTVEQANQVPAGSLDKGWGQTAALATQAASQGIFAVVKKAQSL